MASIITRSPCLMRPSATAVDSAKGTDAAEVFADRDTEKAQRLIEKADGFLKQYDRLTKAAYKSEGEASEAVARALYYRYLKRITAHVMNLMTSLVMPIDRLDYYDEVPEDRD